MSKLLSQALQLPFGAELPNRLAKAAMSVFAATRRVLAQQQRWMKAR